MFGIWLKYGVMFLRTQLLPTRLPALYTASFCKCSTWHSPKTLGCPKCKSHKNILFLWQHWTTFFNLYGVSSSSFCFNGGHQPTLTKDISETSPEMSRFIWKNQLFFWFPCKLTFQVLNIKVVSENVPELARSHVCVQVISVAFWNERMRADLMLASSSGSGWVVVVTVLSDMFVISVFVHILSVDLCVTLDKWQSRCKVETNLAIWPQDIPFTLWHLHTLYERHSEKVWSWCFNWKRNRSVWPQRPCGAPNRTLLVITTVLSLLMNITWVWLWAARLSLNHWQEKTELVSFHHYSETY